MKDLIILVADLDTENVLEGFLPRLETVCGTRPFTFDIYRHMHKDPGCLNEGADFLRSFAGQYQYAIVIFDKEGSGQEQKDREVLEANLEQAITTNGWPAENVAAIAIDPEVENWVWANSPHVATALKWRSPENLYDWLIEKGWLQGQASKPARPKEAVETVLKFTKTHAPRPYTGRLPKGQAF